MGGTRLEDLEGQVYDLLEVGPMADGGFGDRVNVNHAGKHITGNGEIVLQIEAVLSLCLIIIHRVLTEEDHWVKNSLKQMVPVKISLEVLCCLSFIGSSYLMSWCHQSPISEAGS